MTMRPTRMTRHTWITAAAVLVLVALACAASAEIQHVVLDDGLTLVVLPNPWSRAVALSVMVGAGSKYDPEGLEGLAQITNELFFEGLEETPWNEIYDELSAQGVEMKCLTSEDTAEIIMTGHEARFDYMVDMAALALSEPVFLVDRLEHEKKVALDSYEGEIADEWNYSYRALAASLYEDHPYEYTPLGTPEGMDAVTIEDVEAFYEGYYSPANTIIVAVGDLTPESTLARLEDAFAPYDGPAAPPEPVPVPERTSRTIKKLYGGDRPGFVQIGFAGPRPSETDDLAALRVLMAALGAGTDSRLYEMLSGSEEEMVRSAGAFASHRAEQVRLIVYALGASDSETVKNMLDEIERIKTDPPDASELDRAKEDVIGSFALRMQRNAEKASSIARDYFLGLAIDCCDTYVADTEAVTVEQVRAAAERYLVNPAIVFQRSGTAPTKRGI